MNSWSRTGWGGPCPPIGRHRYFFCLYALDTQLVLTDSPTAASVEAAARQHALGSAELMGTYQKKG